MEDSNYYQQKLHIYQKRISNILESFTDGYFEVDLHWTVIYWNAAAEQLLSMPRQQILGNNLWEVYREAIPLKFFTEYHRSVGENVAVRFEEYFPLMGLWFEVAAFPSGDGLSVYFKDITDRKKMVAQLEAEKLKYLTLFNRSPIPQWVYDVEGLNLLDVNSAAIQHYGYSREEFLAMKITDLRPMEDVKLLDDILRLRNEMGSDFNRAYVRHKKKNGEIIEVEVEGNSIDFLGREARMVMVIDRTEDIRNKREIEESMARYDIVSKATSDAIWDWDLKTGQVIWNQGIRGIFGYRKTTFDAKWRSSRIHPEDQDRVERQVGEMIRKNDQRLEMEYRFLCADGSYRTVLDRAFILFDENGTAFRMIGSMQDISERMEHLNRIEMQNARLREISWIQAHMVRAPLANILGLCQLLEAPAITAERDTEAIISLIRLAAEDLDHALGEIIKKT